jgi:hypothetical protein
MQRVGPSTGRSQVSISLAEVSRARPWRGTGTPGRCASHKSAILTLLLARGPAGVLGSELYNFPEKFGRSPRNRISELRAEGHLISGVPRGGSDWHYVLIHTKDGSKPPSNLPDPPAEQPSVSDYMRRSIREQAAAMPLFAGIEP